MAKKARKTYSATKIKSVARQIELQSEQFSHLMWTHGSSAHVENPANLKSSVTGAGTRVSPPEGGGIEWVHFAVPTPAIVSQSSRSIRAVLLNFKAVGIARVNSVHAFDGHFRIAAHDDLNLSGEHFFARFEVPGSPRARWGIGVSVGVSSVINGPNTIDFRAAGAEFVVKTGLLVEAT